MLYVETYTYELVRILQHVRVQLILSICCQCYMYSVNQISESGGENHPPFVTALQLSRTGMPVAVRFWFA
jgi:hypothetical protein